ncbi:MAG: PQQ-binding-like beta-propeller repeat protein [bacterium]|nr:PQQ-binding-like beta-propeller repeat protein [bacterium]
MHHHDPQSTGRSSDTGPKTGNLFWDFDTRAVIGTSIVIGPDSTIYFISSYDTTEQGYDTYLYALSWNDKLKWKFKLKEQSSFATPEHTCSPLIAADGTIYTGSPDKNIYAINNDGTLKWKYKADEQVYSISLCLGLDGTIYFTAKDNALYALNPDGSLKWKSSTNIKFLCSPLAGISQSPDGQTLYLSLGYSEDESNSTGLAAIDVNGMVKWIFETGLVDCTPLVDNQGNIFFGARGEGTNNPARNSGIFSVNSEGNLRWKYNFDYLNNYDLTMDYNGNVYSSALVSGVKPIIISFSNDGTIRWELDISDIGPLSSSLICDRQGTIYGSAKIPPTIYAVSSDGSILWKRSYGVINANSPALANGYLFFGTWFSVLNFQGGKVYCLK